jgi:MFS family permease
VGYYSDKWGRKPLLLLGFGLEIIRALLLAFSANVSVLLIAQFLGGISAAAVTVLTILMITDLTTGSGRFNLVRGAIGTLIAIAASISTSATGFLFETLSNWEGFLILAGFFMCRGSYAPDLLVRSSGGSLRGEAWRRVLCR